MTLCRECIRALTFENVWQEINELDAMRNKAMVELKQAKQRYNQRRNDKYSAAIAKSAGEGGAIASATGSKTVSSGPAWWEKYSKERMRDDDEVLARDLRPPADATNRDMLTSKEVDGCARPLICTSYNDFREERSLLRKEFASLYELCAERGVAFSPVEPFLQLERPEYGRGQREWQWTLTEPKDQNPAAWKDDLVWSRGMLISMLIDIVKCNAWLFWIGATYGWVPTGSLMAQAKKACAWVKSFYDETGFDTASVSEMVFNRYVLEKIDQLPTVLKNKTFFYIRDETYADAMSPEVAFRFVEEDEAIIEQLQRFKESIRLLPSALTTCDYRAPMTAVRQAIDDLTRFVTHTFLPVGTGYERRRERLSHSAFALHRRKPWVARAGTFEMIDNFLDPRNNTLTPLVLVGGAGQGKTALVSNYLIESRYKLPHALWHIYLAGSSPGSCDYQRICIGVQQALKERFRLDLPIAKHLSARNIGRELSQWFAAAASRGLLVVIIDGLDQVEDLYDGGSPLQWLPLKYPARMRLILTTRPDCSAYDECLKRAKVSDWMVHQLEDLDEVSQASVGIQHCKMRRAWTDTKDLTLGPQAVEKIMKHPPCMNPLHLRYLVDELCRQNQLDRLNPHDLFPGSTFEWQMLFRAETPLVLLDYVLHRWDKEFHNVRWPMLVRRVCSLIAASSWGLCEYELLEMMPDVPRLILRQFLETTHLSWVSHSGYYMVAHALMREAIHARYMPAPCDVREVHARLGCYFRSSPGVRRKLEAELYHWRRAELWVNVLGICSDMEVFPFLMEQGDQGSLHADLRRCMRGADKHLDAFQALIDGLSRFERKHAAATDGRVATTAIEVAHFFGEMGRGVAAASMYQTILNQPASVLNASVESRHQVAFSPSSC